MDLREPDGLARALTAVERADVLVEGFRPGAAERLGVGPDVCAQRNPRLVYARMTGWGQEGPRSSQAGHDINYLALTGALHAVGPAGGDPVVPLNLVADFGGGTMLLVTGVLAALLERERSGRGQVVDAAMVDGVSTLMTMTWSLWSAGRWRDERGTNLLDGAAPYYGTYRCADGRYVAVGALEPQFYAQLLAGLGLDGPSQDEPWGPARERLAAAFASRTRDEWTAVFAGSDACVTPVLSLAEAPDDEHLAARRTLRREGPGVRPGPAPRFSRTPAASEPDPRSGEDVLASWTA